VDGTKPAEKCQSIEEVRRGIDSLDHQIVALIGHRARYVDAAGFKKNASDVRATERRSAMMDERRRWAEEEGLSPV
jgi:isochorismate pyruvate lyase